MRATIKSFVEALRPEDLEIRKELDYGYSYDSKIAEIFEIRPHWGKSKRNRSVFVCKNSFLQV